MPTESVANRILLMRGNKVMLDADLADLYGVPTKALNQAVKRNIERFPPDFMFQLSAEEKGEVVTICDHKGEIVFDSTRPDGSPRKLMDVDRLNSMGWLRHTRTSSLARWE